MADELNTIDRSRLKAVRADAQKAMDKKNYITKKKKIMPKKKPFAYMTDDDSGVIYEVRGKNVTKEQFMKSIEQQGKDEAAGAGGYSEGGEVRGSGAAVTGKGFKGVF